VETFEESVRRQERELIERLLIGFRRAEKMGQSERARRFRGSPIAGLSRTRLEFFSRCLRQALRHHVQGKFEIVDITMRGLCRSLGLE